MAKEEEGGKEGREGVLMFILRVSGACSVQLFINCWLDIEAAMLELPI